MHMTSSMNQEPSQEAGQPQIDIESIDQYLEDGMAVFDENGEKAGNVKMYSITAGYLMVGSGAFEHEDLYIPLRLIRNIDPQDIFVSAPKDTLASQYTQAPQIHTIVETRMIAGPGGNTTPQTREVQTIQSGYDSGSVELSSVDVGNVADRLAVGMVVYDTTGKRLGDITQYDTTHSLMVVEKGIFNPRDLIVPFSTIKEIHPDVFTVYLSLPEDALKKQHSMLPADESSR
jgi:ribosomal 30S subunit maturation factor RimM